MRGWVLWEHGNGSKRWHVWCGGLGSNEKGDRWYLTECGKRFVVGVRERATGAAHEPRCRDCPKVAA